MVSQLFQVTLTIEFEVGDEAKQFLNGIKDTNIEVVAIAGKYRTGKSYIINLLIGQPDGFKVSSKNQGCTKGIWIWNKPIEVVKSDGSKVKVLMIDTEGLDDEQNDQNRDLKILTFVTLLSSHLVYNVEKVFDGNTIRQISLVTQVARSLENLQFSTEEHIQLD